MVDRRGSRDILTLDDSELMKRYRLDRAGMFVVDLISVALTFPTQRHNAIPPEMKVITTLLLIGVSASTDIDES